MCSFLLILTALLSNRKTMGGMLGFSSMLVFLSLTCVIFLMRILPPSRCLPACRTSRLLRLPSLLCYPSYTDGFLPPVPVFSLAYSHGLLLFHQFFSALANFSFPSFVIFHTLANSCLLYLSFFLLILILLVVILFSVLITSPS